MNQSLQIKILLALFAAAVVPFSTLAIVSGVATLNSIGGITAGVFLFMGLLVAWGVWSGVVRQASDIQKTLSRINGGDFEARAEISTGDELGQSAEALNAMCDNTLNLIHSNNEQGQVQASIENLISEMKSIAAGNLTIKAEVNEDITGAIASSVNNMTSQLRAIVRQVKNSTDQVTRSATNIVDSSTKMSHDSDNQAREIGTASEKLLEMTNAFQNVAALTEESVQVAVEARATASNGLRAVGDTVDGMQRIRTQVQNTSKRIKRLGESSQEIGEIVQLISDIADRTSVLALNASIQAAMAGDAGQGFAVVAEEVERLAERTASASDQIGKLIRGIQTETGEAIADMDESTREVVSGSQLATQAGSQLTEIDTVTDRLVRLIESVSDSARSHAKDATNVAATMTRISQGTRETAEKSRQSSYSVHQLAQMADELRASMSRFTVDAELQQTQTTTHPQTSNQPFAQSAKPQSQLFGSSKPAAPMVTQPTVAPAAQPPVATQVAQTHFQDEPAANRAMPQPTPTIESTMSMGSGQTDDEDLEQEQFISDQLKAVKDILARQKAEATHVNSDDAN